MTTKSLCLDPGVDVTDLLERVDQDMDLLRDMLDLFRQEFPKLLLLVQEAVNRGDSTQIQESAHTLKGMLAGLSFTRAAESALEIERLARQNSGKTFHQELERLENSVKIGQAYLESFSR